MAIRIKTSDPKGLLASIKKAIDDRHIRTWEVDKDGDFTHTPEQFRHKAWFRPEETEGELRFYILRNSNIEPSRPIYGIYHGRFLEELLTHFYASFDPAWPTSKPISGDHYPI